MSNAPASPGRIRGVLRHVAFRALLKSALINMLAPALIYRLLAPHFPTNDLTPLAVATLPPMIALAYSLIRLRAVDFLGLFAVESAVVNIGALLLAHGEREALIGRSLQNLPLALLFLGSLAIAKPMVQFMARQLATGNDPGAAESFDAAARRPAVFKVYQTLTWVWGLALLVKTAGSLWLATSVTTADFLTFSPIWDLTSDGALVTFSILFGRRRLASASASTARTSTDAVALS
jgi:hypothetical protein